MTSEGGNRIPAKWYAEWKRKHGFERQASDDTLPAWLGAWIEKELGR